MARQVGVVYGWGNDGVHVAVSSSNYTPGIGDLLYVKEDNRIIILQNTGFQGEIPISPASVRAASPGVLAEASRITFAIASLFLEIVHIDNNTSYLAKPMRPPRLMQPVYLVDPSDPEAYSILRELSELTSKVSGASVPVACLRPGPITPATSSQGCMKATGLRMNLADVLSKHVLIVGQTGAGKTSGLKGLLLRYALTSSEKIGWLIIDRHGEYAEDYEPGKFTGYLIDALSSNKNMDGVKVRAIRLTPRIEESIGQSQHQGIYTLRSQPLDASSIGFNDFASLLEGRVSSELIGMIEEFVNIVAGAIRELSTAYPEITGKFLNREADGGAEEPNGNLLALLPLLYDNMIRHEGIGKSRDERRGLLKILVDQGIYTNHVRVIRRNILGLMGWRIRYEKINSPSSTIGVIDDSRSVIKVTDILRDARKLLWLLTRLSEALGAEIARYPWLEVARKVEKPTLETIDLLDINRVVEWVNKGDIVILDLSRLSNEQADLVALTVSRRIFEERLTAGVEASRGEPVVAIVSEEAPLYLSPDKVRTPFNPFARIAREGRKFRVGLLAITQLASIIEKQLLGNFNTLITLRTKSRSDIDLLRDIGVPSETLPFLGDREGYIYSPDLPVKEPFPVYIPAWFEHKEEIEKVRSELDRQKKSVEKAGRFFMEE